MSGFERSAPIPGSQGPRRSKMVRFNNAPPPLTPWRAEVLEAQKQLEALEAAAKRSRSVSRSRSRNRKERDRDREREQRERERELRSRAGASTARGHAPATSSTSGRRPDASAVAPETGVVLRQARERGEGWYAAVARAAEQWDTVPTGKKPPKAPGQGDEAKKNAKDALKKKAKEKEAEKGEVGKKRAVDETELERQRREEREVKEAPPAAGSRARWGPEEEKREQERQRLEFEAKAEERRLKADEERRKAEEDRKKSQELKKQRQERLKGAFAVGGDDSDKDDREAALVRRAAERKRAHIAEASSTRAAVAPREAPLGPAASASPPGSPPMALPPPPALSSAATLAAVAGNLALLPKSGVGRPPVDPELSEKLRFEPGLNPAEAFMRLQERKRKGRRAEFGGPPRGCSPWRDGKRGVSFDKNGEEA